MYSISIKRNEVDLCSIFEEVVGNVTEEMVDEFAAISTNGMYLQILYFRLPPPQWQTPYHKSRHRTAGSLRRKRGKKRIPFSRRSCFLLFTPMKMAKVFCPDFCVSADDRSSVLT